MVYFAAQLLSAPHRHDYLDTRMDLIQRSVLVWIAGTDEKAIISVMGYRSASQRADIVSMFKAMYGKVSHNDSLVARADFW